MGEWEGRVYGSGMNKYTGIKGTRILNPSWDITSDLFFFASLARLASSAFLFSSSSLSLASFYGKMKNLES